MPGIILLGMLLLLIGGMFSGFRYSGATGFFTMAVFGSALLMLVAYVLGERFIDPNFKPKHYQPVTDLDRRVFENI